mgnify:CR=1 FL=1
MSRLGPSIVALFVWPLLLGGCGQNEPRWADLPSSSQKGYTASVKTFGGAYADHPFEVWVESKSLPGHKNVILRASQCKNVKILPREDFIYVFYDELVLAGFSSNQFDGSLPRPFLCDIRHNFCGDMLRAAVRANESISAVCSYS